MRRAVLLSFVIALSVSAPPVSAEEAKPEAPEDTAKPEREPAKEVRAAREIRLHHRARATRIGIATSRTPALGGPRSDVRLAKDGPVVVHDRAVIDGPGAGRRAAVSPLDALFDRLRGEVTSKRPRARGAIRVSFTVGRDGRPRGALVLGMNRRLERHLEGVLAGSLLPRRYAGQHVTTTLRFAPPAKKRNTNRSRAKRRQRRK